MQVTNLQQKLKTTGLRLTRAREAIVDSLKKSTEPISIADLTSTTDVDQATIYRNIPALIKAGVIESITVGPNDVRYSLTNHHHDHAICNECGKIEHIHCTAPKTPKISSFAKIDHHEVTYYGLCKNCSS